MEKPSGLGDLSGSIDNMTSTISFSVKGFNNPKFKFAVTSEGMFDKKSAGKSSSEEPSSWNSCWKWDVATCFKRGCPLMTSPSLVDISEMWFWERRYLHCLWKNEVFIAPAWSKRLRDLRCQYSSSWWKERKELRWAFCSMSNWDLVASVSSMSNWISAKSCTVYCLLHVWEERGFFAQLFKAYLVYLSFFSHTKLGDPSTGCDQAWATMSINPSLTTQRGLNLNGIGPKSSSFLVATRWGYGQMLSWEKFWRD